MRWVPDAIAKAGRCLKGMMSLAPKFRVSGMAKEWLCMLQGKVSSSLILEKILVSSFNL